MIAPLTMTVRDVLFVHWSVSPDIVRSRLTRRIEALTAGDSASKLLSYLLEREQAGEVDIQSCAELARRLDIGRASLYRALDSLETSGDIRREGKKIFITVKNRE